jgi:hypothetical protein
MPTLDGGAPVAFASSQALLPPLSQR